MSAGGRSLRADAQRNRARVLAAAAELFAEVGPQVGMQDVARRAGVGVGTVARSFGSKHALVDAVLAEIARPLLDSAKVALDGPVVEDGLVGFLDELVEAQVRHKLLGERLATAGAGAAPPPGDERAELIEAVDRLVRRAQEDGALRDDVSAGDVLVLVVGVAQTVATALAGDVAPSRRAHDLRRRYLALAWDGLRAAGGSPLPGRPLDLTELHRGGGAAVPR